MLEAKTTNSTTNFQVPSVCSGLLCNLSLSFEVEHFFKRFQNKFSVVIVEQMS